MGEEPVGAAARALHAHLIVVASDASDHTWRRAKSFAAGTDQQCVRLPYTKDALGTATGRTSLAIAAITDPLLATALVQALPEPNAAVLSVLTAKAEKLKKRQSEAKAHQRNRQFGKRRPVTKKEH